ncbi:MAG: hypothetical protein OXT67_01055 [Zetaproteobacteria bacterium]|nr:hypothetical protein [Zetaproteobacteria bacterium]
MRTRAKSMLSTLWRFLQQLSDLFLLRLLGVSVILALIAYLIALPLQQYATEMNTLQRTLNAELRQTSQFLVTELHAVREKLETLSQEELHSYAQWRLLHENLSHGIIDAMAWMRPQGCEIIRRVQLMVEADFSCTHVAPGSPWPVGDLVGRGESPPFLRIRLPTRFGLLVGGVAFNERWLAVHPRVQQLQQKWNLALTQTPSTLEGSQLVATLQSWVLESEQPLSVVSTHWLVKVLGAEVMLWAQLMQWSAFWLTVWSLVLALVLVGVLAGKYHWHLASALRLDRFLHDLSQQGVEQWSSLREQQPTLPAGVAAFWQACMTRFVEQEVRYQSLQREHSDLCRSHLDLEQRAQAQLHKLQRYVSLHVLGKPAVQLIGMARHELRLECEHGQELQRCLDQEIGSSLGVLQHLVGELRTGVERDGARRTIRTLAESPAEKEGFKHQLAYILDMWLRTGQKLHLSLEHLKLHFTQWRQLAECRRQRYDWMHRLVAPGREPGFALKVCLQQLQNSLTQGKEQDYHYVEFPGQLFVQTKMLPWWYAVLQLSSQLCLQNWQRMRLSPSSTWISLYAHAAPPRLLFTIRLQIFAVQTSAEEEMTRHLEQLLEMRQCHLQSISQPDRWELQLHLSAAVQQECGTAQAQLVAAGERASPTAHRWLQ